MTLLVAYASRHGATHGIAERIGGRLAAGGAVVDVRHVGNVRDLSGYGTVVLGAPVYGGTWPEEFKRFLDAHRDELAERPVWLFSVGSFDDTARLTRRIVRHEPRGIDPIRVQIGVCDYRVFRGVIQTDQWPFWSRVLYRVLGGKFGDHRNWPAIDAWADEISDAVPAEVGQPQS